MWVIIHQYGATMIFKNNNIMKKWTDLLVGDPIYILKYVKKI